MKEYEQGVMSKYLCGLKKGDKVEFKGPIAKIEYVPNQKDHIGMIAGGTGITPMIQVLHKILENPEDKTRVSLVFCNVTEQDILLKQLLDEWALKHSNFKVHYVVEKSNDAKFKGSLGYFTEDLARKYLPPATDGEKAIIYACGPPPMISAVCGSKAPDYPQGEVGGILKKLGYQKNQVFKF